MATCKCKVCGSVFESKEQNNKFCDECRTRILVDYQKYLQGKRRKLAYCIVCGKTIKIHAYTTCSPECRLILKSIKGQHQKKKQDGTTTKLNERINKEIKIMKEKTLII